VGRHTRPVCHLFGGAMTGPLVRKRNRPGPLEWLLAVVGCAIVGSQQFCLWTTLSGIPIGPRFHPWWTGRGACLQRYSPWPFCGHMFELKRTSQIERKRN